MLPDLNTVDEGDGFNVKCGKKKPIVIFQKRTNNNEQEFLDGGERRARGRRKP